MGVEEEISISYFYFEGYMAVTSEPDYFGPPANIVLDHVSKYISASLIG
jgi:hypothetical protein